MDRQTFPLLIVLFLVLMFHRAILDMIWPPPPPGSQPSSTNQTVRVDGPPGVSTNVTTATSAPDPLIGMTRPPLPADAKTEAIENADCRVEFTSQGGGIDRVILKKFTDLGTEPVILNRQSPLAMGAVSLKGISFWTPSAMSVSSNQVTAVCQSTNGLVVTREYTLKPDCRVGEVLTLRNGNTNATERLVVRVAAGMAGPMDLRERGVPFGFIQRIFFSLFGILEPISADERGDYLGLSFRVGEKPVHEGFLALKGMVEKQKKTFERKDPIGWVAVKNQYFAQMVTPGSPFAHVEAATLVLPQDKDPQAARNPGGVYAVAATPSFSLEPGASTNMTFEWYVGPKQYKSLRAFGQGQDEILELEVFGMSFFKPFSRALFWLLEIFHGTFRNWGVSIIVVTVLLKILFWPLTAIQNRNMKKMQALAPKMTAIKEKYKDDQQKQSQEMWKLQSEYGINPLAGCLPILVQIPIFIAFYNLLRTGVELRGSSFLWIKDLSMPDTIFTIPGIDFPVNLMPLLMLGTMIWQMRVTPQAPNMDPSMKIMMTIMPVFFLWICYGFSSGLSLYMTFNNLLTILQTRLTRDQPLEPPQKIKRRAAFTFGRPLPKKT